MVRPDPIEQAVSDALRQSKTRAEYVKAVVAAQREQSLRQSRRPWLNAIPFIAMVIGGIYLDLDALFFWLVVVGSLFAASGGWAHFSRGYLFTRGKGDVIGTVAIVIALLLGVYVGFAFGFWWGLFSCMLFWPVMYRLGVKLVIRPPRT